MARRRKRPEAHQLGDGLWHVWVDVGTKPNGKTQRRHVKRADRDEAEDEAERLLEEVKTGQVVKSGRKHTVQSWMTFYIDTIAPERCNPSTCYDYQSKMRNWVYPVYGEKWLRDLEPDDLDKIYATMRAANKAQSHRLKVHRILSRALDIALRRGFVSRNVAKLIDAPSVDPVRIKAVAEDVALKILAATEGRPNQERWTIAFAMGLRQGEAIGLRWTDPEDDTPLIDLDAGLMHVWYQLRRQIYQHGCGGTCAGKRGADCPQRSGGGLVYRKCKGKSKRTIPIPPELIPPLRALRARQRVERLSLGPLWRAGSALFTTYGRLVDPRDDYDEWVSILAAAGVKHMKPHIMRHTAATLLLQQGVSLRAVQELLGHRDIKTTGIYTQDVDVLLTEAMSKTLLAPRKVKKPKKDKIKGAKKGALHVVA